jgi:hypothetical protein
MNVSKQSTSRRGYATSAIVFFLVALGMLLSGLQNVARLIVFMMAIAGALVCLIQFFRHCRREP